MSILRRALILLSLAAVLAPAALIGNADALGDCCICHDCPGAGLICIEEFEDCVGECEIRGCSGLVSTTIFAECFELPECNVVAAPVLSWPWAIGLAVLLAAIGTFRIVRRGSPDAVAAAFLVAFVLASVSVIAGSFMSGGGEWQSVKQSNTAVTGQTWSVDATRSADGSVEGTISIAGSPLVGTGTVAAQINGDEIAGSIANEAGRDVITFTGTVEGEQISGTYTTRGGDTGAFTWEPAVVL